MVKLFLSVIIGVLWIMPVDAAVVCDGVADDTAALQTAIDQANGDWVNLPAGTCRITSELTRFGGGGYQDAWGYFHKPGLRLHGAGKFATTILADFDGDDQNGGIIHIDTQTARNYVDGISLQDLRITQAPGRTGLNGVQLTAAWNVHIQRVLIDRLSGSGIKASWRPDLNPTNSDFYQSFAVVIEQSQLELNKGWGIDFGAGQSPGLYTAHQNLIIRNAGGGVRTTTGQFELVANVINGNGTQGGNGGLLFDSVEGQSHVADVRQNEFDTNFNWHIHMKRSRDAHIHLNRFLSGTFSTPTGFVHQSGSAYMRPYVHVNLGFGELNEVWNAVIENNYHRTVTGPSKTTATVYGYAASGGSLSPNFPCHLRNNDFGPSDGITQNSSGLTKYVGFVGTGAEIIDP